MAGEPIRKFASTNPRPLGAGRDLRAVANARAATAEAAASEGRARGERRGTERLRVEKVGGLQQAIDEPASEQSFFLPRQAGGMTLFLVAAYAMAALVFQGLPSTNTMTFALASATLFACGSLFAATERLAEEINGMRLGIVFVGIVLPMACSGLALALWVSEGLPWQWAIGTLVCINAAAAALFDMRIISLFCAKIASWGGGCRAGARLDHLCRSLRRRAHPDAHRAARMEGRAAPPPRPRGPRTCRRARRGHPAGDALLKQVAQRLERAIDGHGRCGRLGGDEFKVIVPGHQDRRTLGHMAQEIIASLSQPYSIEGQSVVIGASVGIALAPEHGSTSDELIRNVDLALYAAKDAGRGVFRFYAEDLHAAAEERAELEQDLREAIAKGELELYYQPVVYAANEKIVGFEALTARSRRCSSSGCA